jgi:GH24 family phage-related lysozyme (muramidase)
MLTKAGYKVKRDGFYGPATEAIIKKLQQKYSLEITGDVDNNTWNAIEIEAFSRSQNQDISDIARETETKRDTSTESVVPDKHTNEIKFGFADFKGQLEWIHNQEGHAGKPYWPGGRSGITLDPGFDLGYQDIDITYEYYKDILNAEQLKAIGPIIGLKGREAKNQLNQSATLLSIRISKSQASKVFPLIALPYWKAICKRMVGLNDPETPGSVQTALLSLAFNRGYKNADLEVLKSPIKQGGWSQCAHLISGMQQDHKLEGIKKRRQREGKLILDNLI